MDVVTEQVTLPRFTREEVSAWFTAFSVSFMDPNEFCAIVFNLRDNYQDPGLMDPDERALKESGAIMLWGILEDISQHPSHRHRQDARNIIEEVEARERDDDESLLIPDPLPRPYIGDDRRTTPRRLRPDQELSPENIAMRLPRRLPDDDLPLPFLWGVRPFTAPPPEEYEYNDGLADYVAGDIGVAEIDAARIEASLDASVYGEIDPGLLPYKYMDDPAEDVLNMPDDCPFITAPTPPHNERLLDQSSWPALNIYDERIVEGTGPIEASNYIYKMLAWARQRMAQPDTARSYCIIFRSNPRRYQVDTDDEISEEPPPTTEECKYECTVACCSPTEGGHLITNLY